MADEKKAPDAATADVISFGAELPSGEVPFVRTRADEEGNLTIEGGVAAITEGEPPASNGDGELLRLEHLHDNHFEVVEVLGKGPVKVNSRAYRQNWDSIFGAKQTVGQA